MVVQQILNVQPESDTAYIAGIQQKSIPFEHRFILNIESNLKQLRYVFFIIFMLFCEVQQ